MREKDLKKEKLLNNEQELYKLIKILKEKYNISFRIIAETIEVNREKIRKIYNKRI